MSAQLIERDLTNREINAEYLLYNKNSTQEEIDKMTDEEIADLVTFLVENYTY